MDAEVERVLFDWTNGAVKSPANSLDVFPEYQGQILDYTEVARFYAFFNQDKSGPTKFRSIVPGWDNTARYGNLSFALSGESSKSFEFWLKALIEEAGHNDSPFVFINAWNEWAEGAHLEADARYGYANLNSVGRALTGRLKDPKMNQPIRKVYLEIDKVSSWPDSSAWINTFECLDWALSRLGIDWEFKFDTSLDLGLADNYILRIVSPCLFSIDAIQKLISEAGESVVSSFTMMYSNTEIEKITSFSNPGPILLYRKNCPPIDLSEIVVIEGCRAFPLDRNGSAFSDNSVMTIMSVEDQTLASTLTNSLLCLAVQVGFSPRIVLRCRTMTLARQNWLTEIVDWARTALRLKISVMCSSGTLENEEGGHGFFVENDELTQTRFLHYLHAGEEMFPFAYKYLVSRVDTGFLATFARLYDSERSSMSEIILNRKHDSYPQSDLLELPRQVRFTPHNCFINLQMIESTEVLDFYNYHLSNYQLVSEVFSKNLVDLDSLSSEIFLGDSFPS
jgi:hypothetical protein